jgi:hypothetical protein
VLSRSAVRGRLGTRPAPSGPRRLGGVLALQRMAGNRAVRALIARDAKVIKIGNESVRVSSDAEQAEAERIIKDVKTKFGVSFDSLAAHTATMADSDGSAPEDRRKALAVRAWELDELKAIERALTHFAPVLGEARKKTLPKGPPQEFVNVGKLNSSPDDDPKILGDRTRGQFFHDAQTFAVFEPGPDSPAGDDAVERVATHEIAHGIFDPLIDSFMQATGYWEKEKVRRKEGQRVEGPPDGYADRNAREDLAQSVMYFFVDPERLRKGDGRGRAKGTWGNPCPKRYAFIRKVVAGWTKKR